jgi:hypothetical protein
MRVVDIASIRRIHPGLMAFPAWRANRGAERLAALLPERTGGILASLPAWRLESIPD